MRPVYRSGPAATGPSTAAIASVGRVVAVVVAVPPPAAVAATRPTITEALARLRNIG